MTSTAGTIAEMGWFMCLVPVCIALGVTFLVGLVFKGRE